MNPAWSDDVGSGAHHPTVRSEARRLAKECRSRTSTAPYNKTFTAANWNTNQPVTLAAAQDADTTNGSRTFTVASTGIPSITVTATEIDDDAANGKVDNPYSGATGYINPDWHDEVVAEANNHTG